MLLEESAVALGYVALLAEGVDRNDFFVGSGKYFCQVALLAEGVDRNKIAVFTHRWSPVALLAEGVDRNKMLKNH